jgi:hypothetical protein
LRLRADVANQRQLAEKIMGIEFGHVGIGSAAEIEAERRENHRRQCCERHRKAQRDRMFPVIHNQRISMT